MHKRWQSQCPVWVGYGRCSYQGVVSGPGVSSEVGILGDQSRVHILPFALQIHAVVIDCLLVCYDIDPDCM